MSTQDKARALMQGHYQACKNRQQSMLERVGKEIGLTGDIADYWNPIQGKIDPSKLMCDRSNTAIN
jgi:hypothetical protein